MRQIGELLKDLGFNPDSPLETQKAFVRHLICTADQVESVRQATNMLTASPGEQLAFDPVVLGILPTEAAILKLKRSR